MSKPGFMLLHDDAGRAAVIVSITDGQKPIECVRLVIADDHGITEIPLSGRDLAWLISELQERLETPNGH